MSHIAENAWNSKDPEKVARAYTLDCQWCNRAEIFSWRECIIEFEVMSEWYFISLKFLKQVFEY